MSNRPQMVQEMYPSDLLRILGGKLQLPQCKADYVRIFRGTRYANGGPSLGRGLLVNLKKLGGLLIPQPRHVCCLLIPTYYHNVGYRIDEWIATKPHGLQSSILKTEPADAPVDIKSPTSGRSPKNVVENAHRLTVLTSRANQLKEEQEMHSERAEELRGNINQAELACGRMTQQLLDAQEDMRKLSQRIQGTQEAIRIRKRHIREDEERLSGELRSRDRKMEQIMSILSQMHSLALDTSSQTSAGDM